MWLLRKIFKNDLQHFYRRRYLCKQLATTTATIYTLTVVFLQLQSFLWIHKVNWPNLYNSCSKCRPYINCKHRFNHIYTCRVSPVFDWPLLSKRTRQYSVFLLIYFSFCKTLVSFVAKALLWAGLFVTILTFW